MKKMRSLLLFLILLFSTSPTHAKIWTHANSDGFGDANNTRSEGLIVYDGQLYSGTSDINDSAPPPVGFAEVWRYEEGTNWTRIDDGWGDNYN